MCSTAGSALGTHLTTQPRKIDGCVGLVVAVSSHESVTFRGRAGHFCGRVARLATRQGRLDLSSPTLCRVPISTMCSTAGSAIHERGYPMCGLGAMCVVYVGICLQELTKSSDILILDAPPPPPCAPPRGLRLEARSKSTIRVVS
jgi:hypothetical protein